MILRNRLKERRAALGVNQQEMGRLCGVSRQTISLIERGDYSPSVTLALTIAKVCGVTVEEVFYLREETEEQENCSFAVLLALGTMVFTVKEEFCAKAMPRAAKYNCALSKKE